MAASPTLLTDEQYLQSVFPDAPVMVEIAKAEAPDGRGSINCKQKNPASSATGCFQILKGTWKWFRCAGDPWDREDNAACARRIYVRNGTSDWTESEASWGR